MIILRGSVYSRILEMDTGITVIAPSNNCGPLKATYLLHGLCGNSGNWADYTMLPHYAREYKSLFILPEVNRSFYTDMKFGLRYFSYITNELPEICRNVFQISTKREDTAIMGASMGGYGALKCALSRPEQYGVCCAFSSACLFLKEGLGAMQDPKNHETFKAVYGEQLYRDFQAMFGPDLEWRTENDLPDLAKRAEKSPLKPRIFMTCGREDSLYAENDRFAREMKNRAFDFIFDASSGRHDWDYFNGALRKACSIML